jgi:6-phosphogluconolactonase (cycloisomerase 2 family)
MSMKVRALLSFGVVFSAMWMSGCGHYICHTTLGNSSCTPSGGGLSSGGGGGGATADAFLFVADAGGIQGLDVSTSAGTITNIPNPVTGIPNVFNYWMVIAQGKYMYVGYPSIGLIYAYSIAADGTLSAIGSPFNVPYLIGSTIGGSQAIITNPAGTLLFVLEPSANALYVYSIGTGGGLTQVGSVVALPFEPFNLATDGLGKYLYVSNSVGGSTNAIEAYAIGSGGTLTTVPNSPFVSNGVNLNYALAQMQGDSSGKYMIGTTSSATGGDPHLYVLGIQSDGEIIPVTNSPFPTTASPSFVAVQPSTGGTIVYSITVDGSAVGGQVEGFQLSPSTGALTAIAGSPFFVTGDYGQFDQAGTFFFVRDLFNKDMSVYSVGSSGVLTTADAQVGWGPGSWAPVDIP